MRVPLGRAEERQQRTCRLLDGCLVTASDRGAEQPHTRGHFNEERAHDGTCLTAISFHSAEGGAVSVRSYTLAPE